MNIVGWRTVVMRASVTLSLAGLADPAVTPWAIASL
jgi:hypothetical protein